MNQRENDHTNLLFLLSLLGTFMLSSLLSIRLIIYNQVSLNQFFGANLLVSSIFVAVLAMVRLVIRKVREHKE